MAAPINVRTEPQDKLVFNSPMVSPQKINLRITNPGAKRIGWQIKSTDIQRYKVEPTTGCLAPMEQIVLDVTCNPFDVEKAGNLSKEHVTIEWVNAPEGGTIYSQEWFKSSGHQSRLVIPIEFNS